MSARPRRAALRLREKLYLAILPVVLASLALMSQCTADRESVLRQQSEASLVLVQMLDGIEKLLDDPSRDLLTLSRAADFHDAIFWERSQLEAEATERSGDLRRFLAGFRAKAPQYRALAYLTARRASDDAPWSVTVLECVPAPPCAAGGPFADGLLATGRALLADPRRTEIGPGLPDERPAASVRYATLVEEREGEGARGEVGVLVVDLDLDAIAREMERASRDAGAAAVLRGADGATLRAVATGPASEAGAGASPAGAALDPIRPGSPVHVGYAGGRVVGATVSSAAPPRVRALGWSLALALPPQRAHLPVLLVPGEIHVLTGGLAIVVSAVCLWGLGWATRPLRDLAAAMGRTGEGDLRTEVEEGADDEIGRLARSFNHMVRALRASRAELASQLEESLRLKTTLENVIDSTPSAVVVVDRDGRVLQWNEAAERQTGRKREKVLGALLFREVAELARYRESFERVLRERVPIQTAREEYLLPGGETGIRRLSLFPVVSATDEVDGVVLSSEDVTQEERIERMMVHAEKMAMIGRLAANMAHEIKNPLAGILWNLHNLERRLHPASPVARGRMADAGLDEDAITRFARFLDAQKIPHYVAVIRECGLRADGIVKTLGDFSARGEKQVEADPRTLIDSTLMLARAAFDLEKRNDFRDIDLAVEVDGEVPMIHCNVQRIEQVLLNLVNNAAQALFNRRQQDPSFAPRITFRVSGDDEHARIEVEDNGAGIPPEAREHIFEPFYTTKEVGEGTGLGLSISYLIVTEGHSGRMWVEDGASGGARFVIELPARHAVEGAA